MRYYKYNFEYYYTGFEESDIEITSSTTIVPDSSDHIVWNPDSQVWGLEIDNEQTLDEAKTEYIHLIHDYFEDTMDSVKATMANFEQDTYQTQETEWRAYEQDNNALTPYVDKLAELRSIPKDYLMQRIGSNVLFFADIQGNMYALEDAVNAQETVEGVYGLPYPWL